MSESYYLVQQISIDDNNQSICSEPIPFPTMKTIIEYSLPIFNSQKTYMTHTENTNEYILKSSDNENIIFFILEINNYLV